MSSDWKMSQLRDCCDFNPSSIKSNWPHKFIRYIDISSVGEGYQVEQFKLLPRSEAPSRAQRLVASGDSLISTVRPNRRSMLWLGTVAENMVASTGFAVLRAKAGIMSPRFLYYTIFNQTFTDFLITREKGAAYPAVSTTDIGDAEIKIPPLSEQYAIAEILGTLDDRIALLRETNITLEAIAQALFKSWFVDFDPVHAKQEGREPEGIGSATAKLFPDNFEETDLGLVPKGWQIKRLGDITERITKGTTPTTLKRPFVESGINFIKVESLTGDGEFIPEKFAYIDIDTHELLKRSQLLSGDVLITIAGTIGRIAVITDDFLPANTNQAVALIRPDENILPGGLIKHFLQKDDSRQTMIERVVQAVQANLSLGSISDLKILLPPAKVVKQLYSTGIEQIDASKRRNQQHIRTLATLRDTLLPRLISGQLRLPDSEALVEEATA